MLGLPVANDDTRALFYVPSGRNEPGHFPKGWSRIRQGAGGPDYDPVNHKGGFGLMIGGPWHKEQKGWKKTRAGYWVNLSRSTPADLAKLTQVDGIAVRGAKPEHYWTVPHLISRVDREWRSALESVLTPQGWSEPEGYSEISNRLADAMRHAQELAEDDPENLLELSIDLLKINYHTRREDLEVSGWFTESMMPRIIAAAAGIELGDG